jgi:hypothetical protein
MRRWLMVVAATLVGTAAFAQDVKTDYDKSVDFAAFKTFAIQIGTSWNNPLGEKRVLGEIQETLIAKGWTLADPAQADALVVLHGASEKQKTLNTFYSGTGGYGRYGYRGGMGMGSATTTTSEYLVGTLVVDIFDAKTKQLIFRGTATDELSDKPEKNQKKVTKASEKMFKDFPPGSAKGKDKDKGKDK